MVPILDQYGRPLPVQPRRALDLATTAGIRNPAQRWNTALPATPENVFSALQQAVEGGAGSGDAYLTLAEQMEERYLHYAGVLQTRKLAITGVSIDVLPGAPGARAQKIADEFRERVVEDDCFQDLLNGLLDAIAKGYSVVQPVWKTTADGWDYECFKHEDPRMFMFDRETMSELRIRSDINSAEGLRLPTGQFIVHRPRLRTGITIRAGIARAAAVGYLMNTTNMRQWATFIDVYGMPLRLGKFDPNSATELEMDALRRAVVNLGHDAAAILPLGMEIEFPDARRPTSGDNVYEGHAKYWDAAISKLVLGQTMTTEDGSSKAQAEVHDDVRVDIKRADAKPLASTIRRDVAAPWVLYNFGAKAAVPRLRFDIEPGEDLVAFSAALAPLIKAGLKVKAHEVREKFGLTEPEPDDELVELPPAAPAPDVNPLAH